MLNTDTEETVVPQEKLYEAALRRVLGKGPLGFQDGYQADVAIDGAFARGSYRSNEGDTVAWSVALDPGRGWVATIAVNDGAATEVYVGWAHRALTEALDIAISAAFVEIDDARDRTLEATAVKVGSDDELAAEVAELSKLRDPALRDRHADAVYAALDLGKAIHEWDPDEDGAAMLADLRTRHLRAWRLVEALEEELCRRGILPLRPRARAA